MTGLIKELRALKYKNANITVAAFAIMADMAILFSEQENTDRIVDLKCQI